MARLNSLWGKSGKHRTTDVKDMKYKSNNMWRKSPKTLARSLITRTPESTFCHLDFFSKMLPEDVEQVYDFCWNLPIPQSCSHHFSLAIHACTYTFISAHTHTCMHTYIHKCTYTSIFTCILPVFSRWWDERTFEMNFPLLASGTELECRKKF